MEPYVHPTPFIDMAPLIMPTPFDLIHEMFVLASLSSSDVLYDLGCGDGRIVIAAARAGVARAVGIDNDPRWIDLAQRNAQLAGVERQTAFLTQNIFLADISQASIVTLYTDAWTTLRLRPKLCSELAPGSRVISHSYGMCEWVPDRQIVAHGRTLFLWVMPKPQIGAANYRLSCRRKHILRTDSSPKRGVSITLDWHINRRSIALAHPIKDCVTSIPSTDLPILVINNPKRHGIAALVLRCRFEAMGGHRISLGRFSYLFVPAMFTSNAWFPNIPDIEAPGSITSEAECRVSHDKLAAFCMSRLGDEMWETGLLSLEKVFFADSTQRCSTNM